MSTLSTQLPWLAFLEVLSIEDALARMQISKYFDKFVLPLRSLQVFFYSFGVSFFRTEGRLSYFAIVKLYDDEKTAFSFPGGADGAGRFLQQRCNF